MKQISNKEYEKYQQYQTDKLHGRILTPDGLRIICAGLDNDPEKIGKHILEMLAKFRNRLSAFDQHCSVCPVWGGQKESQAGRLADLRKGAVSQCRSGRKPRCADRHAARVPGICKGAVNRRAAGYGKEA